MKCTEKKILLFVFCAVLISVGGCSTNEPQNASVRPWNAPQSWESSLPIDMGQHE
jgi:hypothetical protein